MDDLHDILDEDTSNGLDRYPGTVSGVGSRPRAKSTGSSLIPSSKSQPHSQSSPRSYDDLIHPPHTSLRPVTQLPSFQNPHRTDVQGQGHSNDLHNGVPGDLYQVVKDFDPKFFGHSGRPQLEMPLKAGDLVRVLG